VPIIVRCPYGHDWKVTFQKYKNGRRCSSCKKEDKNGKGKTNWSINLINEELEKENYILISDSYKDSKSKIKVKCSAGHEIEIYWSHFLKGVRCRKCWLQKSSVQQRFSIKEVDSFLESIGYKRIGEYVNSHKKMTVVCNNGHRTEMLLSNLRSGIRCKYCHFSLGEKEVIDHLESLGVTYDREVHYKNNSGESMFFDFVIYDINGNVLFIIEYDGIHHFEERELFKNTLDYVLERDDRKDAFCKENGISILRIPYTEFSRVGDLINEYISKLNISLN